MTRVLTPLVIGVAGSSWVAGRYAGWVERLARELVLQPEARGPIRILNVGQGGATSSVVLATQIPRLCALRPSHVFIDPGHVNSSADTGGGPAVSRAQTIADIQAMVAQLRAAIPGVDITLCTMHAISATSLTIHPAYADYVADVRATAAVLDVRLLDTNAAWPSPLDPTLTYGAAPFVIGVTAGYDPMADGAGWNAGDKSSSIVVDADLLRLYAQAGGSIRGNTAVAGKIHFEVTMLSNGAGGFPVIGLATAAAPLATPIGQAGGSISISPSANVQMNGAAAGPFAPFGFTTGETIGIEVDRPNNLVYFMKGATRSAGYDIAPLVGPLFPAVSFNSIGQGVRARFTPSGDGLHPLNPGAVDVYHYPAALAWARARAVEFWGL